MTLKFMHDWTHSVNKDKVTNQKLQNCTNTMGRLFQWDLPIRPKKKNCYVALTRPKFKNWVGRFFFIFFYVPWESWVFQYFFKVSKWGKLGRNAVKTHIYKCFFKPLNTNFSKFFAQIWHKKKKKKKKKNPTLFFRILRSVGRGQHNNFFWGLMKGLALLFTFCVWFSPCSQSRNSS